ncbi:hypothetical protein BDZ94DRAFT_620791 [Collybia nuda]|uniref:Uncharacterized protein n=1 Tax=Collybia nuda TaxID=64659 RepID=A0A9P5Y6Y3_9AGAR|nr:hypothetical protein BDZ94DRAFT_620791 [Collybia nuda]
MLYSNVARLFVSVILAMRVVGAPPSRKIIQASTSHVSAATAELSPHSITVDYKNRAWEGKNWHYRVPNPATGKQEEFTVYVVDAQFGDEPSGTTKFTRTGIFILRPMIIILMRQRVLRRGNICAMLRKSPPTPVASILWNVSGSAHRMNSSQSVRNSL